ncbi:hypothetical protein MMC28_002781 [Mycoblastus sanguinarius]|nr:hypothetical protein [Mycoblastus sanguinarius]
MYIAYLLLSSFSTFTTLASANPALGDPWYRGPIISRSTAKPSTFSSSATRPSMLSNSATATSDSSPASLRSSALSAFDASNAVGITSGAPNDSLPDPCGPPIQSPNHPVQQSTCLSAVSAATYPEVYGFECLQDDTGYQLNQATCSDAIYDICWQMYYNGPAPGQWYWSSDGFDNCTFGFWLPLGNETAPTPSYNRCLYQIFSPMIGTCVGNPKFNVGAINLVSLPSTILNSTGQVISSTTGEAVDPNYPSYVMVAQSSNSEDSATPG